MTSTQSFKIYEVLQKHFNDEKDARTVVEEIEAAFNSTLESKKDVFLTKDDKVDIISQMKSDKIDLIKWMVGFWVLQIAAIIGLYTRK